MALFQFYVMPRLSVACRCLSVRTLCTQIAGNERKINVEKLDLLIHNPKSRKWLNEEYKKKVKAAKKARKLRKTPGQKKGWDGYRLTADHVFWEQYYKRRNEMDSQYLTSPDALSRNLIVYGPKSHLTTAPTPFEESAKLAPWQKWIAAGAFTFMILGYLAVRYTFGGSTAEAQIMEGVTQKDPFSQTRNQQLQQNCLPADS